MSAVSIAFVVFSFSLSGLLMPVWKFEILGMHPWLSGFLFESTFATIIFGSLHYSHTGIEGSTSHLTS